MKKIEYEITLCSEVENWLSKMKDKKYKGKLLALIEELKTNGHNLKQPKCKYLEDDIWELKCKNSNNNYRIFYFYNGNSIILSHYIKKQSDKYFKKLKVVKSYREEYLKKIA